MAKTSEHRKAARTHAMKRLMERHELSITELRALEKMCRTAVRRTLRGKSSNQANQVRRAYTVGMAHDKNRCSVVCHLENKSVRCIYDRRLRAVVTVLPR